MTVYEARKGQVSYGYTIGMLSAEWHIAFPPGDIGNASTFDFPIRYLGIEGMDGSAVLNGADPDSTGRVVEAALQLQDEGVRAITSNCGFMAAYQPAVAEALDIPVFLSSLQQLPMLTTMLGSHRQLALVTANGANMTPTLLEAAGFTDLDRLHVVGMEEYEHFVDAIFRETGTLDTEIMERDVVDAAVRATREAPIGGIFLECSDLPPYTSAVHRATGLPVWDWTQFIRYVHAAVAPRPYTGTF
ncbi:MULTISPECIES: aspartate/glutamate racemase family protein [unclassified Aeromicrobium]|uniref:aspartate/glutamate racemase family protein n=1 Tax=unclassified Aeromicrobium TaxID=2633570 RepID=UPI00396B09B6